MDKWITFDCYGTLVDWRTGMGNSLEIVAPGRGADMLSLHRKIEGEIEMQEAYRPYREVLAESVRRMARSLQLPLGPGDEEILAATLPFWPVYPDTNEALLELKRAGWKLAILSNVDRDLITGTLRHFSCLIDLVVTAQDVRSYKPADAHARRFLELTGVSSDRWLYAAVNLQYDLRPGRALGANCVWINREREPMPDDPDILFGESAGMSGLPRIAAQFEMSRSVSQAGERK
ncbi:(S)-2-haloacid dehalogenase 4A [Variovorax sp. SRS16]|uniref:HAD hydrolase-like protein n=1 Tax=Variovorax sp. SRS16 TaxID=282217 RepID=UPI001315DC30|nr:HAD family hydrolase [Variovorax sp. SRS16]VTU13425.1 (S)-2-haloacid dehalogenase 4A [Variovorax sp. SRS16]